MGSAADVSLSGVFASDEQHPDAEIVVAVSKDAPAKSAVILTVRAQPSATVFEESFVGTVYSEAANAHVSDSEDGFFTTKKSIRSSYAAVGNVAHLAKIR